MEREEKKRKERKTTNNINMEKQNNWNKHFKTKRKKNNYKTKTKNMYLYYRDMFFLEAKVPTRNALHVVRVANFFETPARNAPHRRPNEVSEIVRFRLKRPIIDF